MCIRDRSWGTLHRSRLVHAGDVTDPTGDDTGPGTYTYPTDAVFQPGNFDITNFQVAADDENVIFRFTMAGPVENPWDGANGLSLQTFDIYVDQDGDGEGGVAFLPGRNLSLAEGSAWDYAITIEGWESKIFTPGDEGPTEIAGPGDFAVITDPGPVSYTHLDVYKRQGCGRYAWPSGRPAGCPE